MAFAGRVFYQQHLAHADETAFAVAGSDTNTVIQVDDVLPARRRMPVQIVLGLRFAWYYFTDGGGGHVQSVVVGSLALILAAIAAMIGLLADLISTNRKLLERTNLRLQRMEAQWMARDAERADA